jgi:hypothetical protein
VVLGAQHAARLLPALMGLAPKDEPQPGGEGGSASSGTLGGLQVGRYQQWALCPGPGPSFVPLGWYSQDPLFLHRNVYKTESFRCQNSDTHLYSRW